MEVNWINVFALAEKNTYMFQKASHNNRDTENICMTTEKGISAHFGFAWCHCSGGVVSELTGVTLRRAMESQVIAASRCPSEDLLA